MLGSKVAAAGPYAAAQLLAKAKAPIRIHLIARRFLCNYPEHEKIFMPALSPTMETGNLAKWNVQVGGEITPGMNIADIETDKATVSLDAQDDGYLAKIVVGDGGENIPVGDLIGIMVTEEEDIAAFKDFVDSSGAPTAPTPTPAPATPQPAAPAAAAPKVAAPAPVPTSAAGSPTSKPLSPAVGWLISNHNLDASSIVATGPKGYLLKGDVLNHIASGGSVMAVAASAPVVISTDSHVDVLNNAEKQQWAQHLVSSKQACPHHYQVVSCNVDTVIALCDTLNTRLKEGQAPVDVHSFAVKAAAYACRMVPSVNSTYMENAARQYQTLVVGIHDARLKKITEHAVQKCFTAHSLLHDVAGLGLQRVAQTLQDARDLGDAAAASHAPATFSMHIHDDASTLLMSAPAVAPGQAALLSVGGMRQDIVVDSAGGFGPATMMTVTLSCDHRVVDGADSAIWLDHFKKSLSKPTMLL